MDYHVIGLMSGTSLDGLDIAYCKFFSEGGWKFQLLHSETIIYDDEWKDKLKRVHLMSAEDISRLDALYGMYLGSMVNHFCSKHSIRPDFISSHGHTVFHQPHNGFTKQLGSGAHLAGESGMTVVCDFRSLDVALGGQGAPLVPIGDKYLFSEMDFCLNLGGIANVSFGKGDERIAFDVCPCNMVLNYFAGKKGFDYDKDGELASQGKINIELLNRLNSLSYYSKPFPKSLGREDVELEIIPLIESFNINVEDVLSTFCKHIALQISRAVSSADAGKKMLITGGGTFNAFLIKIIKGESEIQIEIPAKDIVEYKEAIIFAFLGVLRMRGEANCLKSVTGARRNNCGGAIYLP